MKLTRTILICAALNFASYFAKSQTTTIASFTPASGSIGTPVTITGANFSTTPANNTVHFGATAATVTAATATELSVSVPAGATYQPITVTVNGLTAYSNAPFIVTFASNKIIDASSFAEKIDFATGLNPFAVVIGDFDGDGKSDLVTSDAYGGALSVLKNHSSAGSITSGSFDSKLDVSTGYGPFGLAVGDLDGDGKLDLVTLYNGTTISIYKNVSTSGSIVAGSFAPATDFLVGYNMALAEVAIGDLDGDGKPDLAMTDQYNSKVLVYKNTTTPGIIDGNSFAKVITMETAASPRWLAIADLDADGKPELAIANVNGNSVSVFKNTSTAGILDANSFAPKVNFTSGPNGTNDLAIGDLDGDGKPDIAVCNYYSNTISILRNISSPGVITENSFAAKVDFATSTGPQTIAMGDLDGDGKVDLAVANFSANVTDATANKISVFKNMTTIGSITSNSFQSKVDFATGTNPVTVAIGDLDGDGRPDLAVTNYNGNSLSVLWSKESQTITTFAEIPEKKMDDPSFLLSSTSSSGLPVQFTTTSDRVSISGNQATIAKPGSVTITAEQPGNNQFSSAPKMSHTFCIIPSKPTIIVNLTDPANPVLTSSSDVGNLWYLNDNLIQDASEKTYTVKDKGAYKVKVSIDGCVGPMSEGQPFLITGDLSQEQATTVLLYPNPAHDLVTIRLNGFKEYDDVNVSLFDGIGQAMTTQTGKGGQEFTVDIRNYTNGFYYVVMTQGNLNQQLRFIKK